MAIRSLISLYTCSDKNLHNKAKMWEYFISMKCTFCIDFVCIYIWVPMCHGALVKARGSHFFPSTLGALERLDLGRKMSCPSEQSCWPFNSHLTKQTNKKEPEDLAAEKRLLGCDKVPNQQNCYLTSSPDSSDSSTTACCRKNYRYSDHRVKENRHEVRGIIWVVTSVRAQRAHKESFHPPMSWNIQLTMIYEMV